MAQAHVICALLELADRDARTFTIPNDYWPLRGLLVRCGAAVHAYVNRCPHAGHPLNMRPNDVLTADRSLILCNSHGALFALETGACVGGPCNGQALTRIPVRIENGNVVVENVDALARQLA